jgi:hypothetical protein
MESLFILNWIFKNPTLKRAEIKIQSYPENIVNSGKDLQKNGQGKPKALEEYLFGEVWGELTKKFQKNFQGINAQKLDRRLVSFAYTTKVETSEVLNILKKLGLGVSLVRESEIKGKFGFYRF